MFKVFWNNIEIGVLSKISTDMWYLEGEIEFSKSQESIAFETKMQSYEVKSTMQQPENALRVILASIENSDTKLYCLVMSLNGNSLFLRQVVSPEAMKLFFPNV